MKWRKGAYRVRWLGALLACIAPLALAFGLLVGFGALAPWPAVAAGFALAVVFGGLLWAGLAGLAGLAAYVDRVAGRIEFGPSTPPEHLLIGRVLADAVGHLIDNRDDVVRRLATSFSDLERALDALPGPLLLLDAEGAIVRSNQAAQNLLGGTLAGRNITVVLRHPDLLNAIEAARREHQGRDLVFTLPLPVEQIFAARVEPLLDPAADGSAMVVALMDLTASRRTDQMRADFVANASHEIRTPLSVLIGFIETLQGPAREDAEARERFLAIMAQNAKRMARLVDDLLSLSRIEMNEHTPPTGRVDLKATVRTATDTLAYQAEQRNVTIALDWGDGVAAAIGDEGELALAIQNLISNAIKYGPTGGTVTIEARRVQRVPGSVGWPVSRQGALALTVIDHGEGIAKEHIPRLTERFYRVDTARSRELGGTGLGLAIVKHIISRHRGSLQIDSTPGKGSRFTLFLQPAD
jgi:two-component system phosphate regulon sensor histidine kinase PhoR